MTSPSAPRPAADKRAAAATQRPARTRSPLTPLIDLIALLLFALVARMAHGGVSFTAVIATFWPWAIAALIGWAIVLAFKVRGRWTEGLIIWLTTVVAGMIIWAVANSKFPHWSFLLVATIMSALFLFGWRAVAGLIAKRRAA